MSFTEQGIWEKMLEKRENFLGDFNVASGDGALTQSIALKSTQVLQVRIP